MQKDTFITDVVFYKHPEWHDITAILGRKQRNGLYVCYSHIGQHSEASESFIKECTPIPAQNEAEYKDLHTELESVGCNLKVKSNIRFF